MLRKKEAKIKTYIINKEGQVNVGCLNKQQKKQQIRKG